MAARTRPLEKLEVNHSFWHQRSVLVSGANGYLGSNLVRMLVKTGVEVVCLVRDWTPKSELYRSGLDQHVRIVRGDLMDRELLERIIAEYQIQTVFHTAESRDHATAQTHPVATFETNVAGIWNLLEACRRYPHCGQVVLAATDGESCLTANGPVSNSTKSQLKRDLRPLTISRQCGELIARSYAHSQGLKVVQCRFGMLIGPGDLNWQHTLPGMIRHYVTNNPAPLTVNRQYLPSLLAIDDATLTMLNLAQSLTKHDEITGASFSFGLQEQLTGRQLAEILQQILGVETPQTYLEQDQIYPAANMNLAKAAKILRWKPQFSLLDALTRTCEWYRHFLLQAHTDRTTLPFLRMSTAVDPAAKSA
jgi:CDP-glucose 4,6-dehydratase